MIKSNDVSVIIPTLNRGKTIKRAIKSVLLQTCLPGEIIIVDNGSTDDTKKIIQSSFPQVNLIKEKKRGVSFARNSGIKQAKGNWVAFLDSDDEWHSQKLETQINCYNKSKIKYKLIHTNEIWYMNGVKKNQKFKHIKSGGYIFDNCLKLCVISPSSTMILKSVFDNLGMFDEELPVCEDYDLWLRITAQEKVLYVDKPLIIKHGGHDDQLSKKYLIMDRFRINSLEKLISNKGLSDQQRKKTIVMLIKKIKIVLNGALKRKNTQLINLYSSKLVFWETYF